MIKKNGKKLTINRRIGYSINRIIGYSFKICLFKKQINRKIASLCFKCSLNIIWNKNYRYSFESNKLFD